MSQEIQFESHIHEFRGLSDEKSQREAEFEMCSFTATVSHFSVAPVSLQTSVLPGMCAHLIGQHTAQDCFIAFLSKVKSSAG